MANSMMSSVLDALRTAVRRGAADLTDAQLLDLYVAQQDEAAFAAIVRRHGPMVLAVCRRVLPNLPDAEDAFRASQQLLSQFFARMSVALARGRVGDDAVMPGEAETMARLAAHADAAGWAALRDRIERDFTDADQLNLDRKQAILGAFFAVEELAR